MNQFLSIFVAAGTLLVDAQYTPVGKAQALTVGYVVFSLLNVGLGLNARSERVRFQPRDHL